MSGTGVIVIGAGPAGLASAACLKQAGIEPLLLEKTGGVGATWRHHYDRLHLHTDRGHSGLPGLPMPRTYLRYPTRAQVVDYLEGYAEHFGLRPQLNTTATRAVRENGAWSVETTAGTHHAPTVVVATGFAAWPFRPAFPGEGRFGGEILHSRDYRNPAPYAGNRVLVVGFGNSGGEIALDLAEAGVSVTLAVRGAVNIVPRDLLGIPILTVAILMRRLPPALADALGAPLTRLSARSCPTPTAPLTQTACPRPAGADQRARTVFLRILYFASGSVARDRTGSPTHRNPCRRRLGEAARLISPVRETAQPPAPAGTARAS